MSPASDTQNRHLTNKRDAGFERSLIEEYLLGKGYRRSDLKNLPVVQRKELLKEASIYASLKMADIEARSKFSHKIKPP